METKQKEQDPEIVKLKAQAYDTLTMIQALNRRLGTINKLIENHNRKK